MREYRKRLILTPVRLIAFFIVGLFSASTISSQQAPGPESPVSTTTVRTTTHLVLVDVVVYDNQGNHITNLTAADFTLRDRGKPQTISVFYNDHAGESPTEKAPPPRPLPAGVFTNRPAFNRAQQGPPTILLLDGLNTALGDQLNSQAEMLKYLRTQLSEERKIAILSLNESLSLLQDFTSDPRLLIAALDKIKPGTSKELSGSGVQKISPNEASIMPAQMMRIIDANNQSRVAEDTDSRVRITLEALRSIARAFGGFPGRKNLIWVSSVFPFSLQPGSGEYPDAQRNYDGDVRRTAALLASARVAVYTVDTRGLIVGSIFGRLGPGPLVETIERPNESRSMDEQIANSHDATVDSHETMRDLATNTGGLALYNRNDIEHAVAISAADGEHYYTLGYYPEGARWDGKFHNIEVKPNREGLKVRHRSGYFAVDVAQSSASENPQQRAHQAYEELRAALADPLPATQVTFRVHIPAIVAAPKPQVQIQFLVDTSAISFDAIENGVHHCNLDFMVAAVSPDGKIVASDGHTVDAHLSSDQFAQMNKDGLPFTMQLPLAPAEYSLRMAVRDNRSGQIGTLTLPLVVQTPRMVDN
jgi:VWFA-related protein